jgi:hypothetical protein
VPEDHGRDVFVLADRKAGGDAVLTHSETSIGFVMLPAGLLWPSLIRGYVQHGGGLSGGGRGCGANAWLRVTRIRV